MARILVVLACIASVLALVTAYAQHAFVNSGQFANRATVALRDDSVRTLVAERITDEVVLRNESDLLAVRPLIQSVAASVVGGRAFTGLFRSSVRDAHRALFFHDQRTVALTLGDVGTVLGAALRVVRPKVAHQVEDAGRVELLRRRVDAAGLRAAHVARTVRVLAGVLLAVAVLLAAAALALSRDRRRTTVELGAGLAAGGVLVVVLLAAGRSLAVGEVHGAEERAAANAVWDAFLGDLRVASWILAGAGAVVAASAASLIRPIDMREPLRRAGRWAATEPARPLTRVLRAGCFVAAGVLLLTARDAVIALLFTVVGIYLIYVGVNAVLWLVYEPGVRRRAQAAGARDLRAAVAAGVAIVLVAGAVTLFLGSGGATATAPPAGTCEGHAELCDRPFDQVALAATHNAMSVPLPGWYSAEQDHPIADQLRAGVRGLLVDTHYADKLPSGRLRTVFGDESKLRQVVAHDGVSPQAVEAALRIRERLGFRGEGKRGMYLCHTFCELGGTPLRSVLDDLRTFLVANPGEVVVVINEDYVTPEDFVGAVRGAGLEGFAYRGPSTGRWPTLRQMIDRNQRLVLLAENHAGAAPWYRPAFEAITEDTPFTFPRVADLTDPARLPASCRPNRGPPGAPLFLVNHWISTDPVPKPSDAARVNAYAPLLARLRECERIRSHRPNLVAVNFYARGDVFRVVDTLNGVG